MPRRRRIPCPHCGELYKEGRPSCPHCGADAETAWRSKEDQDLAAVDLDFTSLSDDEYEFFVNSGGLDTDRTAPRGPRDRPDRTQRRRGEPVPLLALILFLLLLGGAILKSILG